MNKKHLGQMAKGAITMSLSCLIMFYAFVQSYQLEDSLSTNILLAVLISMCGFMCGALIIWRYIVYENNVGSILEKLVARNTNLNDTEEKDN